MEHNLGGIFRTPDTTPRVTVVMAIVNIMIGLVTPPYGLLLSS